MVASKSLQAMENKIDQYKKDCSLKDKIVIELQNQNKILLEKLEKQKSKFEKSLIERKVELDKENKKIEYLKAQAIIIYGEKAKQVEEDSSS